MKSAVPSHSKFEFCNYSYIRRMIIKVSYTNITGNKCKCTSTRSLPVPLLAKQRLSLVYRLELQTLPFCNSWNRPARGSRAPDKKSKTEK